jgi:1,4-alpha-glucan branching enzyme
VTFALPLDSPPGAVCVAGPFNDWTPGATPLKKSTKNGDRRATVTLPAGERIPFRYVTADGEQWFDDEAPDEWQPNDHGGSDGVVVT